MTERCHHRNVGTDGTFTYFSLRAESGERPLCLQFLCPRESEHQPRLIGYPMRVQLRRLIEQLLVGRRGFLHPIEVLQATLGEIWGQTGRSPVFLLAQWRKETGHVPSVPIFPYFRPHISVPIFPRPA